MDVKLILTALLGLILLLSPLVAGIQYLGKRLSDEERMERRLRNVQ